MSTTSESTNPALPDISASTPPIVQGEPVELIGGVFVIPDRRVQVVPNVGIVVGRDAALVIDSGLGPRNGDYVLEHAKQLAGKRPLYLTVTHFHPEHGFGAQAFKGVATIVYNRAQRDELRRKGGGYVEMFKSMSAAVATELADVQFVDPDLVYDGQVEIDLGGHTVVLRHVGPAHTTGDQAVIVDERILFGGDLVETRRFPILPYFPPFDVDVDGKRWIEVLDSLLAWQPEIVVPGHGEVTDASLIRGVREYLVFVRDEAARLRADGASAGSAVATIGNAARARWSTWEDPEWIDFAARWFYEAAA